MSTTANDMRREAIRKTLAHHAGGAPDAGAVAEATLSVWHQVAGRLAPVIGTGGVDALFRRSLHLTSANFPWLAISDDAGNNAALLASFKARLASRETDTAVEAGHALLVIFTELLASLIGESLTERLLRPVWAPQPTASEQETAP